MSCLLSWFLFICYCFVGCFVLLVELTYISFYLFLRVELFLLFILFWVGAINLNGFRLGYIFTFFYALLASLPILVGIVYIYDFLFSTNFLIRGVDFLSGFFIFV
jgi:hypothetical protein